MDRPPTNHHFCSLGSKEDLEVRSSGGGGECGKTSVDGYPIRHFLYTYAPAPARSRFGRSGGGIRLSGL